MRVTDEECVAQLSPTRAAKFLRAELYDALRKVLFRNYREGRSAVEGFADDYAFLIQGLFDLYEASFDVGWLAFLGAAAGPHPLRMSNPAEAIRPMM